MGMYDNVYGNVKCSNCGSIQTVYFQTKELGCDLTEYVEGSEVEEHVEYTDFCGTRYDYDIIYPSTYDYRCKNCNKVMELIAIVRNGKIVRILDGNILQQERVFNPCAKYNKKITYYNYPSRKYPSLEYGDVVGIGDNTMFQAMTDFNKKWIDKHPEDKYDEIV